MGSVDKVKVEDVGKSETVSKPAGNPTAEETAKSSAAEEHPSSPASSSRNDSFVDDTEGSLAGAIGRTLDVCVQAIEEAVVDGNQPTAGSAEDAVAATASDVFSVASSVFTGVSKVLEAVEDANKDTDRDASFQSADEVKVEDVASDDEEWSIVSDEKEKARAKDAGIVGTLNVEEEKDLSILGTEPLSPVLTAKWDTELRQLHGLGFLDDRKNLDALAHLEAAHLGCNSEEEISSDSVVGRLLDA